MHSHRHTQSKKKREWRSKCQKERTLGGYAPAQQQCQTQRTLQIIRAHNCIVPWPYYAPLRSIWNPSRHLGLPHVHSCRGLGPSPTTFFNYFIHLSLIAKLTKTDQQPIMQHELLYNNKINDTDCIKNSPLAHTSKEEERVKKQMPAGAQQQCQTQRTLQRIHAHVHTHTLCASLTTKYCLGPWLRGTPSMDLQ